MSTKGFKPIRACGAPDVTVKRQKGGRTGLALLAGACLGAVVVCAVLMPLVYFTLADLQAKVDKLSDDGVQKALKLRSDSAVVATDSLGETAEFQSADGNSDDRQRRDAGGSGPVRPQPPPRPRSGAVYVRWGRDSCSSDVETLYSGIMGGGHYSHHGGGGNYQCLPLDDVVWNKPQAGYQHHSYMYGAEYQTGPGFFSADNMPDGITNPANYDVPCSVCHVPGRFSNVMIPARMSCPQGWSKEYSGYLMSSYYSHNSNKDFICVDEAPNLVPGSAADQNGALLYLVEAQCGSLPNGPYVNGYELTCVVCTK
ncbi:PREDICTED: uncharacterized protein LOC109479948 [Branchiostoma belcheri]|uniref:Uncharacterized protein LOC109479948 n=1 Tax=Branchiostoma belcheri TaxID=7741 RepID=A0A6P5A2Z2_BRABE|nr:PREDICTED: uncharacterized protein LOC109479948 [Branchiostoma belcheri]